MRIVSDLVVRHRVFDLCWRALCNQTGPMIIAVTDYSDKVCLFNLEQTEFPRVTVLQYYDWQSRTP